MTVTSPAQLSLAAGSAHNGNQFSGGQCRQPYALYGDSNALWLEARDDTVFVGTRLGLFALAGENGHLRWHALPATDLSFVDPAPLPV